MKLVEPKKGTTMETLGRRFRVAQPKKGRSIGRYIFVQLLRMLCWSR